MPPARTQNYCDMQEDEKSERMPIFLIIIWPHQYWFLQTRRKVCRGCDFPTRLCRRKKGRLKRMSPTCWADIVDMMLATDTNVCRLGGVADRHKSRHCQPRYFIANFVILINTFFVFAVVIAISHALPKFSNLFPVSYERHVKEHVASKNCCTWWSI